MAHKRMKAAPVQADEQHTQADEPQAETGQKRYTHASVRERLPELSWPMGSREFALAFGMKSGAARMWLRTLLKAGDLTQFEDRQYALPGMVMSQKTRNPRGARGDSVYYAPLRAKLKRLIWPMSRSQFIREIEAAKNSLPAHQRPAHGGLAIFFVFLKAGVLVQVAPRLYAPADAQAAQDGPPPQEAMGEKSDLRLRFARVFNSLPLTFTASEFAEAGKLSTRHAHTVLSRYTQNGTLTRTGVGSYTRTFTPLPLSFTLAQFALHFGTEESAASKTLRALVRQGQIPPPEAGVYTINQGMMNSLEQREHLILPNQLKKLTAAGTP